MAPRRAATGTKREARPHPGIALLSMIPYILTERDFSLYPDLAAGGLTPGDVVWGPKQTNYADDTGTVGGGAADSVRGVKGRRADGGGHKGR